MANISIDQLANAITDAVREYTEDVSEAIEAKAEEVAEAIRETAAQDAPERTGAYKKGFKVTRQKFADGRVRFVVWNKKHYMRVHLLEFGHALRKGGRARAFPHLRPAYDRHVKELDEGIKRIIRNGGGR